MEKIRKTTEIVIYTNPTILEEKRGLPGKPSGMFFWMFTRPPKQIQLIKKIWFATKGRVRGYFLVDGDNYDEIEWYATSWVECRKKIEIKAFRGFRYRWW